MNNETNQEPLISCVMPTFNQAGYIGQAIESVLTQTYQNIELIIVDNFSTDQTAKTIKEYSQKDVRIKYFQFKNNGIIAASRNHGIKQAGGKYVAFIDSDDLWMKNKLEEQIKLCKTNPQVGLVFGFSKTFSDDPSKESKIMGPKHTFKIENIYERLICNNFVTSSSAMVRADILLLLNGFDEDEKLRCSEDFDLWLRVTKDYDAACVDAVIVKYRVHEKNESAGSNQLQKALNVIEKHLDKGWISKDLANRARANFIIYTAWIMLGVDRQKASEHFKYLFKLPRLSFKIRAICICALVFSQLPMVYHLIRQNNLDKKLMECSSNSQRI
jgi:teichuronic acid biosynthesis glycosyltransferase TuaG